MTTRKKLVCDYLVVGGGAASVAFIDTLLTEMPAATKVILVDRKDRPGGHWVDAYGYVRLHQPSLLYGVASRQLEGNWWKCLLLQRTLPWKHRASKKEVLEHFGSFVKDQVKAGRMEYYPNCVYEFDDVGRGGGGGGEQNTGRHTFASLDGTSHYEVSVTHKFVNGVRGECLVPSLCAPAFPVDPAVTLVTPNQLFDDHDAAAPSKRSPETARYVVLGGGKTAMDAVVFLRSVRKVPASRLSWIVPHDMWMLSRDKGNPGTYAQALLDARGDADAAAQAMEQRGQMVRLDPSVVPTRFRYAVVGQDELRYLRQVRDVVRRGRVSSLRRREGGTVVVGFERPGAEDLVLVPQDGERHVFVHCTSPGPFNVVVPTTTGGELFHSERELSLGLLAVPPVSISMSMLAKLESARVRGTLDLAFGRELRHCAATTSRTTDETSSSSCSDNDVLQHVIRGLTMLSEGGTMGGGDPTELFRSHVTLAAFFTVLDPDPMVAYRWLKSNKLSFFSVPGFKSNLLENLSSIVAHGETSGYPEGDLKMIRRMADKLEPLRSIL